MLHVLIFVCWQCLGCRVLTKHSLFCFSKLNVIFFKSCVFSDYTE